MLDDVSVEHDTAGDINDAVELFSVDVATTEIVLFLDMVINIITNHGRSFYLKNDDDDA